MASGLNTSQLPWQLALYARLLYWVPFPPPPPALVGTDTLSAQDYPKILSLPSLDSLDIF